MKGRFLVGILSFAFGLALGLWRPWHRGWFMPMEVSGLGKESHVLSIRENGNEVAWVTLEGKCFEGHDRRETELNCKEWTRRHPLNTPVVQTKER